MSPSYTGSRRWQEVVRFGDLLLAASEREGDHEAVVFAAARSTYAQLTERAFALARALAAAGVRPGAKVGILMPNCLEFAELLFGISLAGAVIVPINARFAPRELRHVIEHGDLEVVFTSDVVVDRVDYVARLHEALPGLSQQPPGPAPLALASAPALRTIVLVGDRKASGMRDVREFAALGAGGGEEEVLRIHRRTAIRSPALMMYTSGTTATPKGCVLSHEALVRTAVVAGRTKFEMTREDRFWDPLPMFHMSAILPLIGVVDAGATFISMTHFEPGAALRMLEEERVTINYSTFPAITQALLHHPDYDPERWRGIRLVNNVAPPDTLADMQRRMPYSIQMSAYGLTECGGVVAMSDPEETLEQRWTSAGTPFEGIELEIRDLETGGPAPPDQPGEIVVRGYSLFDGYYKEPELTARTFDADGWFHTGDVGSLTPDGRVRYLGRTKDMLKVGGENVGALEIESYLATHPAVLIAAVVGVPDPRYGEVPAAFIELRPGAHVSETEIVEYCAGGLAGYKVPRHVRFIAQWPMSATKIQKFRLQEQIAGELAQARADSHT